MSIRGCWEPILDGKADVVYGSRFLGTKAGHRVLYFWHSIGNRLLTLLSNVFTDLNLTDMETCYKVFVRDVAQRLDLQSRDFGIEPEITCKVARMRARIFEVPISVQRPHLRGRQEDRPQGCLQGRLHARPVRALGGAGRRRRRQDAPAHGRPVGLQQVAARPLRRVPRPPDPRGGLGRGQPDPLLRRSRTRRGLRHRAALPARAPPAVRGQVTRAGRLVLLPALGRRSGGPGGRADRLDRLHERARAHRARSARRWWTSRRCCSRADAWCCSCRRCRRSTARSTQRSCTSAATTSTAWRGS